MRLRVHNFSNEAAPGSKSLVEDSYEAQWVRFWPVADHGSFPPPCGGWEADSWAEMPAAD